MNQLFGLCELLKRPEGTRIAYRYLYWDCKELWLLWFICKSLIPLLMWCTSIISGWSQVHYSAKVKRESWIGQVEFFEKDRLTHWRALSIGQSLRHCAEQQDTVPIFLLLFRTAISALFNFQLKCCHRIYFSAVSLTQTHKHTHRHDLSRTQTHTHFHKDSFQIYLGCGINVVVRKECLLIWLERFLCKNKPRCLCPRLQWTYENACWILVSLSEGFLTDV